MSLDLSKPLIPERWITRRMAVVTGLACGGVVVGLLHLAAFVRETFYPPPLPTCFLVHGSAAILPENLPFTGLGSQVRRARDMRLQNIERLQPAQSMCRPENCTPSARRDYRSAIFWYVTERASRLQAFYATWGEEGLAFVQNLYNQSDDAEIEGHMRELHAAGLFEPTHAGLEEVERIVLAKGGLALSPCKAGG